MSFSMETADLLKVNFCGTAVFFAGGNVDFFEPEH